MTWKDSNHKSFWYPSGVAPWKKGAPTGCVCVRIIWYTHTVIILLALFLLSTYCYVFTYSIASYVQPYFFPSPLLLISAAFCNYTEKRFFSMTIYNIPLYTLRVRLKQPWNTWSCCNTINTSLISVGNPSPYISRDVCQKLLRSLPFMKVTLWIWLWLLAISQGINRRCFYPPSPPPKKTRQDLTISWQQKGPQCEQHSRAHSSNFKLCRIVVDWSQSAVAIRHTIMVMGGQADGVPRFASCLRKAQGAEEELGRKDGQWWIVISA